VPLLWNCPQHHTGQSPVCCWGQFPRGPGSSSRAPQAGRHFACLPAIISLIFLGHLCPPNRWLGPGSSSRAPQAGRHFACLPAIISLIFLGHLLGMFSIEIVPSTIQDKVLYVTGDNFLGALDLLPGPLRPGGILLASRPPKQYFRRWQRLQMRNSSSSKLSPAPYRTKSCMLLGTIS
jgi:hypothetical protein